MSTRGVLKFKNEKYGIGHDAYPSGFGEDLRKLKNKKIKFSTLKSKYNMTKGTIPKGIFNQYHWELKNSQMKVGELKVVKMARRVKGKLKDGKYKRTYRKFV